MNKVKFSTFTNAKLDDYIYISRGRDMAMSMEHEFNKPNIQYCQYCGKECKNTNSLVNHERLCKKNPNGKKSPFIELNSSRPAWNKGLTKETDERVRRGAELASKTLTGRVGHKHTEEEKKHLSELAKERGLGGFNMRKAGIYYNGVKLDSSYEVILAEDLDVNNIRWERPSRFTYHMDDTEHTYTPDFYLPDYDIYLDPKNDYLINNVNPNLGYTDIDKIHQVEVENNIKVIILNKDQLNWSSIKDMLR